MITYIKRRRTTVAYKILSAFIAFAFLFSCVIPPGMSYAQFAPVSMLNLPMPGTMLPVSQGYTPAMVVGVTIHPENPLAFDFIVDKGDSGLIGDQLSDESKKLIKYFLATLTVPEDQLWVNLSPYEAGRVISDQFGQTEMGRDLLAQDYLLKQLTASLMYPEDELGKKFWDRVYKKSYDLYGTTEIPMNTFNKIWIIPENATVYEHEGSAYVIESHLKVMLEEDYRAMELHQSSTAQSQAPARDEADDKVLSGIQSEVVREVLIPEIEKEVNEGKTFANLRQIYNSMILAAWYKKSMKNSLLGQVYVDQNKIKGIDLQDKGAKDKIYNQYLEAFKKGVYNYIKEDYDQNLKQVIPRKYFSGGTPGVKGDDVTVVFESEIYDMSKKQLINFLRARGEDGLTDTEFDILEYKLMTSFSRSDRWDIIDQVGGLVSDISDRKVKLAVNFVENAAEGSEGIVIKQPSVQKDSTLAGGSGVPGTGVGTTGVSDVASGQGRETSISLPQESDFPNMSSPVESLISQDTLNNPLTRKISRNFINSYRRVTKWLIPFTLKLRDTGVIDLKTEDGEDLSAEEIYREVDEDIYTPIIETIEGLTPLIADHTSEVMQDPHNKIYPYVQLRVSADQKEVTVPDIGRPLKVGFFAMKGDPWQVGHIFVILKAILHGKLDKVIIGVDNSDPLRKKGLSSLAIREPISIKVLRNLLGDFIQYTNIPKEPNLFDADGEKMIFRLSQLNRNIPINWFYMAGSDHANWLNKDGDADTVFKLYSRIKKNLFGFKQDGKHTINIIFSERIGVEVSEEKLGSLVEQAKKNGVTMGISKIFQPMDTSSTRVRKLHHFWTIPWMMYEFAERFEMWGFEADEIRAKEYENKKNELIEYLVTGLTVDQSVPINIVKRQEMQDKISRGVHKINGAALNELDMFIMKIVVQSDDIPSDYTYLSDYVEEGSSHAERNANNVEWLHEVRQLIFERGEAISEEERRLMPVFGGQEASKVLQGMLDANEISLRDVIKFSSPVASIPNQKLIPLAEQQGLQQHEEDVFNKLVNVSIAVDGLAAFEARSDQEKLKYTKVVLEQTRAWMKWKKANKKTRIFAFGDFLFDVFHIFDKNGEFLHEGGEKPGGAPFNLIAFIQSYLGEEAGALFVAGAGLDQPGADLIKVAEDLGLFRHGFFTFPEKPTSKADVNMRVEQDDKGEEVVLGHDFEITQGAMASISEAIIDLFEEDIAGSEFIVLQSLQMLGTEPIGRASQRVMEIAEENNIPIFYDFNKRQPAYVQAYDGNEAVADEELRKNNVKVTRMSTENVIKMNVEELLYALGHGEKESQRLEKKMGPSQVKELMQKFAQENSEGGWKFLFVTEVKGIHFLQRGRNNEIKSTGYDSTMPLLEEDGEKIKDTVGAGDSVSATIITELMRIMRSSQKIEDLNERQIKSILSYANRVARAVVQVDGAILPKATIAELKAGRLAELEGEAKSSPVTDVRPEIIATDKLNMILDGQLGNNVLQLLVGYVKWLNSQTDIPELKAFESRQTDFLQRGHNYLYIEDVQVIESHIVEAEKSITRIPPLITFTTDNAATQRTSFKLNAILNGEMGENVLELLVGYVGWLNNQTDIPELKAFESRQADFLQRGQKHIYIEEIQRVQAYIVKTEESIATSQVQMKIEAEAKSSPVSVLDAARQVIDEKGSVNADDLIARTGKEREKIITDLESSSDFVKILEGTYMDTGFAETVGVNQSSPVGGIDLNPALLDLQIKRDGNGVPLPINLQPIESMNIEGFFPVIIHITPMSVSPLLMGLLSEAQDVSRLGYIGSMSPMDRTALFTVREFEAAAQIV